MSRCVLSISLLALLPPFISLVARLTALLMMPQLFTIPMIPAMAMPPIPIDLAYSLKICSGVMSPTAVVILGSHMFNTSWGNKSAMPGTMIHQTAREPKQIMNAYFSPMIYPNPNTAAPVFTFSTSLARSARSTPHAIIRVVTFSFHQPKVATKKSYKPPTIPAMSRGLA